MGLGLIATAMAGGLAGLGAGVAKGAEAYGEYLARSTLMEEQANIQKLRDERMAELTEQASIRAEERKRTPYKEAAVRGKGLIDAATTLSEDVAGNVTKNEPTRAQRLALEAQAYEESGLPDVGSSRRTEALAAERLDVERESHRERSAQDERQHRERMTALERQLKQQGQQIGLESRKLALLEEEGKLDRKQKEAIAKAREDYLNEKDPDKKHEKGATYLTLLGKVGERYKEISETDVEGTKRTTGYFDTLSGREVPRGGAKGGETTVPQSAIEYLKKNPGTADAFRSKYKVDPAQYLKSEPAKPDAAAPRPRPNPDSGYTRYGPMTPWSDVEKSVRAGDQAAIRYARERIKNGAGAVGINPPQTLLDYMNALDSQL